jgi:hypothetical protein
VVIGGAIAAFLLAFSLAWPGGVGIALVAGVGVGLAWLAVTLGFLVLRRRAAGNPADGRGTNPR